ncbi:MAG: kynureninase [Candidatus Nanopelagicales bacterium]
MRERFLIPPHDGAEPAVAYMAGNSLGLQPKRVADDLAVELRDWATLAVEGHREATHPWVDFHELLRGRLGRLVGAREVEVVAMNSLTVNLHLMMASFYRPTTDRYRILIEDTAFPSDSYAVRSHAAHRGFDPDDAIMRARPRDGEDNLRTEDVEALLRSDAGTHIALVLFGGVNYYTGELMDIPAITRAGHDAGAVVGWDLAHAAGNVELSLHDWEVDFAAWCTYKYLNSGPGAVAAAFVHELHVGDEAIPRLSGWWSNDPANRFRMLPTLTPVATADAWQLSNPPILALAPVLTSLTMFDAVGMPALRAKSRRLTAYLEDLLDHYVLPLGHRVLTPRDPDRRGSQLSVEVGDRDAPKVAAQLRHEHGVIADVREPNVIRLAPVPMYCTFHDCWRVARALVEVS